MLSKLKTNIVWSGLFLLSYCNYAHKLFSRKFLYTFVIVIIFSGAAHAETEKNYNQSTIQDFQLHGFIALGLIDVDGSDFVNDEEGLSPDLTELGLNTSYQLTDTVRLAGQVVYLNGGNRYAKGFRVDYALLDWAAYTDESWQANIYLGRFKNNHWLYSSSRVVPFARPSIILPQSVYFDGFRDIAVGSDGAYIKVSHSNDKLGNFDFSLSYGKSPISDKQTEILLGDSAFGKTIQDYELHGSVYWQPTFSQWRFGLSLLNSDFHYNQNQDFDVFYNAEFDFQFYTMNAMYEGEYWEFSGEIYQQRFVTDGFYVPGFHKDSTGQGFYGQTRYKVTPNLTLLAKYEYFYLDKNDKDGKKLQETTGVPYYFGFNNDVTLGLAYGVSSNMEVRAEHHWVEGGGRLTPVVVPDPQKNSSEKWTMWAIQFMYWF
ncbi:hypothetical protein [Colwellia sp. E2M01]|uniref:hypothetical protein n=1 Tax=Colwellia sp. E2M01 TaxID=2841561 RepID=UPI001C08E77A|nr:hypothetical protein [Colwellia sp. E2M01]MBU2870724.1 hypothetical protein [Colwellia sp. E2M01]